MGGGGLAMDSRSNHTAGLLDLYHTTDLEEVLKCPSSEFWNR